MSTEKIACYDVSAGKNAKIAAIMTLVFTGLTILGTILSIATRPKYNDVNQGAEEPSGIGAMFGLIFVLITVVGCMITPNIMAHQSLNGKKEYCITVWFGCFLTIAVLITISIVGSFVQIGQPYKNYCAVGTDTCTAQFKYQDTCNHTAPTQRGPPGTTEYVQVSKKYCDSKGTDFPGSWYSDGVIHVVTAFNFILSNAVTFYICWYKKQEFKVGGVTDANVTTATASIVMTPPTLVQATIVTATIVK